MLVGMGDKRVRIGVRGEHAETCPPERVVVHAAVVLDGPEPRPVHDAVAASVSSLRTSIDALRGSGVVLDASVDQIRASASRPWNSEGEQLPLVHQASADLTVTFGDLGALSDWTASHVDTAGFTVQHLDWQLNDETRQRLERQCRRSAYDDALRRAEDYAAAAGLGDLRLRRIRDEEASAGYAPMRMAAAKLDGIELDPQDIRVSATAEVVFEAAADRG